VRVSAHNRAPVEIEHKGTTIRLRGEVNVEIVARLVAALERGGRAAC
jgi:hypothetical protein